jgi:hypothetical protein
VILGQSASRLRFRPLSMDVEKKSDTQSPEEARRTIFSGVASEFQSPSDSLAFMAGSPGILFVPLSVPAHFRQDLVFILICLVLASNLWARPLGLPCGSSFSIE